MEGIVLAGVHAWGECVLESMLCRPLFPVAGFPLVSHTLNWLREGGIGKVSVCANSDTAALRRCLGSGEQMKLNLHYYEDKLPRGPAGCTRDAAVDSTDDTFVVVEGTVLPQVNLAELVAAHRGSGAVLTVVVNRDGGRRNCEALLDRMEPAGIYVFSAAAVAEVSATGYQDIKESLIPRLYAAGLRVSTYAAAAEASQRVTNAASYLAVSQWAVERMSADQTAPPGYVRLGDALVHESARLHATARFVGPVLLGPRSRIEEDAMVIGPTSIGADCLVGSQAVISRSILWSSCQIGAGAVLDHCILTDAAVVERERVMRETVCLARPPRWTWADRVRRLLRRRTVPPTVAYVPAAYPTLPSVSKAKSPSIIIRSDHRRAGAPPAASIAREGDR